MLDMIKEKPIKLDIEISKKSDILKYDINKLLELISQGYKLVLIKPAKVKEVIIEIEVKE